MRDVIELLSGSAVALAELVRTREVSPIDLVEATLARIEAVDGRVNSVVTVDAEGALLAAKGAADRAGRDEAPFTGVPMLIKDGHLTAGMRTTFGSADFARFVPDFDEESVARLRRAGFVVVGKTNLPEFGSLPYTESELLGPCRNPWDRERTPGGSSGGAAAAVAAGIVPAAHGSDGAGSIRIPASNCGLVGLKPARGRISSGPLFGDRLAGLSTAGPLAWDVEDVAALLDVMAGYAPGDPHWAPAPERPFREEVGRSPGRLRIAVVTDLPFGPPDAATSAATSRTADLLGDLGHDVEQATLPISEVILPDFAVVWASGIASLPVDPEHLEPFNRALYDHGQRCSAGRLLQAVTSLQQLAREVVTASLPYDAVLSPTLTRPPLRIGELSALEHDMAGMFRALAAYLGLTPIANVTGQPSISLPLGRSDTDLPLGVMLTGRPADEATLLRVGAQLQEAADWRGHRPAMP